MVIRRANKDAVGYLGQKEKITKDYLVHMGFDMLNEAKSILEKATGPLDTECNSQRIMLLTPTVASGRISFSSRPEPDTHACNQLTQQTHGMSL